MKLTKPAGVAFQIVGFALVFLGLYIATVVNVGVALPVAIVGGWMAFEGGRRARQINVPPKNNALGPESSTCIATQNDFEERWITLTKYDEAARRAVASLESYGAPALEELKKAYEVIGDPSQLPRIAERIARETQENQDPAKLMAKYGITREGNHYVSQGYLYDKLENAVDHAKRFGK